MVGNIVPEDVLSMLSAWNSGDIAETQRWHHKLFPLCRDLLGLATNPIPLKAAMAELGRDSGEMRLPMTRLPANQMSALRESLRAYGMAGATAAVGSA